MATHQLGRVMGTVDVPRGPDVLHRIRVPVEWLDAGETVEFELPRNMKCADCEGGGCDRCGRSGAISIRERRELAEVVQVTLPKREESSEPSSGRSVVLRIPNRGGFADDEELPRGLLLLSVVPADAADPGVVKVEAPPEPPPEAEEAAEPPVASPGAAATEPRRGISWMGVAIVLLILWVLFLIWVRVTGRG